MASLRDEIIHEFKLRYGQQFAAEDELDIQYGPDILLLIDLIDKRFQELEQRPRVCAHYHCDWCQMAAGDIE